MKEKPKQETNFDAHINKEKMLDLEKRIMFEKVSDLSKQETLEEIAKEFFRKFKHTHSPDNYYLALVEFAKWQQERSYSKEEVLEQLNLLYSMKNSMVDTFIKKSDYITNKWFEQFKKK